MAAVMTTAPSPARRPAQSPARAGARPRLVLVPAAPGGPVRRPRVSRSTYRRRRFVAALAAVVVVAAAGRAGAALGGSPLAASGRPPSVTSVVVRPGDSLWTLARRLAPGRDPRPVVDALAAARHGAPLVPGETVVYPR